LLFVFCVCELAYFLASEVLFVEWCGAT
jgi:hypothetical protein